MLVALTLRCLVAAADAYAIPSSALYGIMRVEDGRVGMVHQNHDPARSQDLGPFQVNTAWLGTFTSYWHLRSQAATYRMLRDNACANAYAASAILRYYLQATGNIYAAIGWYHTGPAGSPVAAARYLAKVERMSTQAYSPYVGRPLPKHHPAAIPLHRRSKSAHAP